MYSHVLPQLATLAEVMEGDIRKIPERGQVVQGTTRERQLGQGCPGGRDDTMRNTEKVSIEACCLSYYCML